MGFRSRRWQWRGGGGGGAGASAPAARAPGGRSSLRGFLAWRGEAAFDVAAGAATTLRGPGVVVPALGANRAFRKGDLPPGRYRIEHGGRVVREVVVGDGEDADVGVVELGAD